MKKYCIILLTLSFVFFSSMKVNSQVPAINIYEDSLQAGRDRYINELKEKIKGKEQMMVDSVFQNLKVLGGFPAGNLLFAMNSL